MIIRTLSPIKIILYIILFSFITVANASPHDKNQMIQDAFEKFRIKNNIPGMQLSISLPNETAVRDFVSGKIASNSEIDINPSTLFQLGSNTKAFTAVLIMNQVKLNHLSLNDTIGPWFPEYPEWSLITIRQLLNMTSGIYDYTRTDKFELLVKNNPDKIWSAKELVDYAYQRHAELLYSPGQNWNYSNTNYILLELLLEKLEKTSFENILHNELLGVINLNLKNIVYSPERSTKSTSYYLSHGYGGNCTPPDLFCHADLYNQNLSWARSAGGLLGSAHDMVIWVRNLFNQKILAKADLEIMQQVVCMNQTQCVPGQLLPQDSTANGYGFGLMRTDSGLLDEGNIWWYAGDTYGYDTLWVWFPKSNIAISLTANIDNDQLNNLFLQLVGELHAILTKS